MVAEEVDGTGGLSVTYRKKKQKILEEIKCQ